MPVYRGTGTGTRIMHALVARVVDRGLPVAL
ncbi:hypothetical protein IQ287_15110 [Burkholderia sp. R-69927]|nr:hypothetical protein [Burkholderia sp. R-70006]MBK5062067.1 hypothetical protein [Burkholderia sp. R-70199]MBK5087321.1 hypothetical protein [Burkholderia sp. R-69927]MBK5124246.1 hypothetical protein [Burkholderia sp. R-69980]MBK5166908.1 hypothetical protein [Burkholderia sp. R-70211]MBK5180745.1 hypothetical protein [Burkholderia sp. R-69749]MCI0147818.1 hypothetical protein [Paraburkholderia sediminicola]